jgi:hypothetical membrane protein
VLYACLKSSRPTKAEFSWPRSQDDRKGTSVFFVAHAIAQLAWPGYSISQYDVSALAVTQCGSYTNGAGGLTFYACSPLHLVMNVGFILTGICTTAGSLLTRSIWLRRRVTSVGVVLVAASGCGAILTGLFPANLNFGLHVLGALIYFLTAGSGILLLGFGVRTRSRRLAAWSLALGGTTIAGFVLYNSQTFLGLGPGGMERVLGFSPVVWAIGLGVALLFQGHIDNRAPRVA